MLSLEETKKLFTQEVDKKALQEEEYFNNYRLENKIDEFLDEEIKNTIKNCRQTVSIVMDKIYRDGCDRWVIFQQLQEYLKKNQYIIIDGNYPDNLYFSWR
jgi:hypothetical protein